MPALDMSRLALLSAATVVAFGAVACGDGAKTPSPATVTVTASESTTSDSTMSDSPLSDSSESGASVSVTPEDSESGFADGSDEPTTESTGPTVLSPESARDRDLTLADIFAQSGEWAEERHDIASTKDVKGMAVTTSQCYASGARQLELRLANGFKKFAFSVGQSNSSAASDQVLKLEVYGNEKQVEVRTVPFNRTQDVAVDVAEVNALKIRVYLDSGQDGCGNGAVTAVLYKMRLS